MEEVFKRLYRALKPLEKNLKFAFDERYGYFSTCPSNLGTSLRASVLIRLPELSSKANWPEFRKIVDSFNM